MVPHFTKKEKQNNYAYIDGANLHKGILELGWKLDYKRFRVLLKERYGVEVAYLFLGFLSKNTRMYQDLQRWGYTIIFKPTIPNKDGEINGNCDAEMVLQAASDYYEKKCKKILLVTGDGDFACLAVFLEKKKSLQGILAPNHERCSALLKQHTAFHITFLEELKEKLSYKKDPQNEKTPDQDKT